MEDDRLGRPWSLDLDGNIVDCKGEFVFDVVKCDMDAEEGSVTAMKREIRELVVDLVNDDFANA